MISVCAGVILRSGGVLLARRAPGKKHAGQWEFPGGRVEPGETPEAALKRELREELGIEAEVGAEVARTRHAYEDGEIELVAFLIQKFTGTPALKDHDQFAWVTARDLPRYDLVPADVPIAEKVASHRRRDRYGGTHPKKFEQKYKELAADPDAVAKAKARGSTPAGTHIPVMLKEVLGALAPLEGARVLDCTLGWGGHTAELARRVGPKGSVTALDRDGEELVRTQARLKKLGFEVYAKQSDFAGARAVLAGRGWTAVDALLADLGVSSMQLDRPERGLSFKSDGPLDMRMDRSQGMTAAQWLARAPQEHIADVLTRFGDEPDALAVAAALANLVRTGHMPKTTAQLAAAVTEAKGLGTERFKKRDASTPHPAARTFQALRIAVNTERESLTQLLRDLPGLLRPGGRVVFLTFHSGEEALVQTAFSEQAAKGLWDSPVAAPLKPSSEEVRENPRARSARLWRAVRTAKAV